MGNLERAILELPRLPSGKARKDAYKRTKERYENSIIVKYYNKNKNRKNNKKEVPDANKWLLWIWG